MLPGLLPGWSLGRRLGIRSAPQAAGQCPLFARQPLQASHRPPGGNRFRPSAANAWCIQLSKARALIGREVLAYYHVDFPHLLTVADLNRRNPFTVKRILCPAMSATSEQLKEARTQISGDRKAAKVIYGAIRHPIISTITRDNEQDPDTAALGEFHNPKWRNLKPSKPPPRASSAKSA